MHSRDFLGPKGTLGGGEAAEMPSVEEKLKWNERFSTRTRICLAVVGFLTLFTGVCCQWCESIPECLASVFRLVGDQDAGVGPSEGSAGRSFCS